MQATIQSYIDNSISSTVNLKRDVSEDVVSEIYTQAWKQGLKGITVYREGSRDGILKTEEEPEKILDKRLKNKKRPITIQGRTYKIPSGPEDKLYITINPSPDDPKRPYEVFISTFGADNPELQTITVLLSALLKNINNGPDFIIEDLKKIESSQSPVFWHDVEAGRRYQINSVPRAVSIALEKFIAQVNGREKVAESGDETNINARQCPKCYSLSYISENGCEHCITCGYQKCG
jgi:ribonucleoside-diphosphate reductase alpha chain